MERELKKITMCFRDPAWRNDPRYYSKNMQVFFSSEECVIVFNSYIPAMKNVFFVRNELLPQRKNLSHKKTEDNMHTYNSRTYGYTGRGYFQGGRVKYWTLPNQRIAFNIVNTHEYNINISICILQ